MNNEKIKKRFEVNMLDGDDIHNCGRAMLSAEEVLEYLTEEVEHFVSLARADERRRMVSEITMLPWIYEVILKEDLSPEEAYIQGRNAEKDYILQKIKNLPEANI